MCVFFTPPIMCKKSKRLLLWKVSARVYVVDMFVMHFCAIIFRIYSWEELIPLRVPLSGV